MDTLTNTRGWHPGPGGEPLIGAAELVALLHRFPNVVLWLNGHTHTNAIRPRPRPGPPGPGVLGGHHLRGGGLAVPDAPGGAGRLGRAAVHHLHHGRSRHAAGPARAWPAWPTLSSPDDLAALHRELAANIPFGGAHPGRTGTATDRNVELLISPPFPLSRLPGGPLHPRL